MTMVSALVQRWVCLDGHGWGRGIWCGLRVVLVRVHGRGARWYCSLWLPGRAGNNVSTVALGLMGTHDSRGLTLCGGQGEDGCFVMEWGGEVSVRLAFPKYNWIVKVVIYRPPSARRDELHRWHWDRHHGRGLTRHWEYSWGYLGYNLAFSDRCRQLCVLSKVPILNWSPDY